MYINLPNRPLDTYNGDWPCDMPFVANFSTVQATVPEPSTPALICGGLLVLYGLERRRRVQSESTRLAPVPPDCAVGGA
jgi:hypothetical protein